MSHCVSRAQAPRSPRFPFTRLALALIAGLSALPAPVMAQHGFPSTQAADMALGAPDAGTVADLARAARENGTVRVIVGLRVPTRPEGQLAMSERASQRAAIGQAQAALVAQMPGLQVNRSYQTLSYIAVTVSADELDTLAARPDVTSITPDATGEPALDTSTAIIGAPRMWRSGYRGTDYAVAVLDTGITYRHVAFDRARIPASACFSSNATNVVSLCPNQATSAFGSRSAADCDTAIAGCGHGTHVSAIAAGSQGRSFRGVAPDADIIPIKIFSRFDSTSDCGGSAPCARYYYSDLIAALEHVVVLADTHPIAAVNMSLQGGFFTAECGTFLPAFSAAAANLLSRGIIPVAASGNSFWDGAFAHPACDPSVVAVIATDDSDAVSSFSNLNSVGMFLAAPGVDIEAAYPPGIRHRASLSGTSMASPHVAGAIALLRQARPRASAQAIYNALFCTGTPVARLSFAADFMRINIRDALTQMRRHNQC